MTDQIEELLSWVDKRSAKYRTVYILAVIGCACVYTWYLMLLPDHGMKFALYGALFVWVASFAVGHCFCKRYLELSGKVVSEKINLSEVMRYHSFPHDIYLMCMRRKMRIHMIVMGVVLGGVTLRDLFLG